MTEHEIYSAQFYANPYEFRDKLNQFVRILKVRDEHIAAGNTPWNNFNIKKDMNEPDKYKFYTTISYKELGYNEEVYIGYIQFFEISPSPNAITEVLIKGNKPQSVDPIKIPITLHKLAYLLSNNLTPVDPSKRIEEKFNEFEMNTWDTWTGEKEKEIKSEVTSPINLVESQKNLDEENINQRISSKSYMSQFYKDYSPITAKEILEAIPKAWNRQDSEGGRWGPGIIFEYYKQVKRATIGRYLSAFKKAGITKIIGPNGEDIPIP